MSPVEASSNDSVAVGDVLLGKYRLDAELGRGGMGIVFRAEQLALERGVAIKVLHSELAQQPGVRERFLREGKAASRIPGEHVVRILDVDTLPGGTPFLVMELLEGDDLSFVRQRNSPLPPATAIDYLLQACDAIGRAHERGVVHRDLKPANLFLATAVGKTTCWASGSAGI